MKKFLKVNKSKQEIFDIISCFIFCILLLFSALLVGAPTKYNFAIANVVISIYGLLFIFIKKVVFKDFVLIKNKIDIFMIILLISSTLSLFFRTYASLNDAIISVYLYITIYTMYIVARNLDKTRALKYITNTIIFGSVVFVIFGIDELTSNFFKPLFNNLNLVTLPNIEQRMFSTFSYANAFSAVIAFASILTLDKYIKSKHKAIFGSFFFIQLIGLIMSYSKGTILIFGLILITYLICLRNRENVIKLLSLIILNFVFSLFYLKIYGLFKDTLLVENIWIVTILIYTLNICFILLLNKLEKYIINIKTKYIIGFVITLIIALITFVIATINIDSPITIFKENSTNTKSSYAIKNIIPSHQYTFVFNITSHAKNDSPNTYKIKIIEENKYYDTIQTQETTFGSFDGEKVITMNLSDIATSMSIEITSINFYDKNGLTINSLYVNDEKEILEYKYLPTSIVNKIRDLTFSYKGAWERGVFITDGFKVALQNNPIIGIGGSGWSYVYPSVQDYHYEAKESHCYITELFIEFGIFGVIAYLSIILIIIFEFIKILRNKEKNSLDLTLILAILLLFIHSLIDFDMSFTYIQIMMYTSIALISTSIKSFNKDLIENRLHKILEILLLVILSLASIISIYYNSLEFIIKKYNIENASYTQPIQWVPYNKSYREHYLKYLYTQEDTDKIIKELQIMIKYEPYNNIAINCENLIKYTLKSSKSTEDKILEISNVYEILRNQPVVIDISINHLNAISIDNIATLLENESDEQINLWAEKYIQIFLDNYTQYLSKLLDIENNRLTNMEIDNFNNDFNEIYNKRKNYE